MTGIRVLTAVALLLAQEKNDAEELFRKMEEKISKAATVGVKVTCGIEAMKFSLTGELLLGESGKIRVELEGKMQDKTMKGLLIGDGKQLRLESSEKPAKSFEEPEMAAEPPRSTLVRSGFQGVIDAFDDKSGVSKKGKEPSTLSGFAMGAKEKVGEREGQAVTYKIDWKGYPPAETTVWIDTQTHLPLKRSTKAGGVVLTESYGEFKLDEKIDPAKFELPKETK